MALLKKLRDLSVPVAELDKQKLRTFCTNLTGVTPIGDCQPRQEITVAGEISSMRIVPRAGSPSLEATVSDGTGMLVVVWTGRRRIAGISPGRRLLLSGRGTDQGGRGRILLMNPNYELLA
jgi:RecG-like helicase